MTDDKQKFPLARTALDRAAFERVLSRAAELQTTGADSSELFTEEQLIELGKEVGLSPLHMRQAIAEERTRVTVAPGASTLADYFGPATIEARRMIRVPLSVASQRLERWMDNEECLQPKRRFQERTTWEARRDFLGRIKRGFNMGGRSYALSSAHEVGAVITQVDEQNVLVQLTADFSNTRRGSLWGAASTALGLIGGSAVLMTIATIYGGSLGLAGAVCGALAISGAVAVALIARAHRKLVARAQLSLEQALDCVEQDDDTPQSVLGGLLSVAPRALR